MKSFIAFIKRNNNAPNDRFPENQPNEAYGRNRLVQLEQCVYQQRTSMKA
jgi:hypothetical protein